MKPLAFAIAFACAVTGGCRDMASLSPTGGRGVGALADDAAIDAYQSPRRDSVISDEPGPSDAAPARDASGDGGGVDDVACDACEAARCRDVDGLDLYAMCFLATDVATQGPGAGMAKSQLCTAVLRCARATGCAAVDPQPCFCGEGVSEIQCLAGNAVGPCKTAIEVAAETASAAVIAERLADPSYASGAAFNLLRYCEAPICGDACAGGGGGPRDAGISPDAAVPTDAAVPRDAATPPDAALPPDGGVVVCADLDADGIPDCNETRVQNARFDTGVSSWSAELGVLATWSSALDGLAAASSGSMMVTNTNVIATTGITMAGASQCIPAAAGVTFAVATQILIPPAQGAGSAALSIHFFAAASCAGQVSGAWASPGVTTAGTWTTVSGAPAAPSNARSMRVRLVVTKPFSAPALRAHFDNVLVEQP